MTLEEFNCKFPDEKACRAHWKARRERIGVTCSKCETNEMYWNQTNEQWRCKFCKTPISLRKGTVMEKSHLPFRKWYMAFFLLSSTKRRISAAEMQVQLGHKSYEPIWYMMKKIKDCIGDAENHDELSGHLDSDDAFIMVVSAKTARSI